MFCLLLIRNQKFARLLAQLNELRTHLLDYLIKKMCVENVGDVEDIGETCYIVCYSTDSHYTSIIIVLSFTFDFLLATFNKNLMMCCICSKCITTTQKVLKEG